MITEQTFGCTGNGVWIVSGLPDHVRFRSHSVAAEADLLAEKDLIGEAYDLYYKERGYSQIASLRAKIANPGLLAAGQTVLGIDRWLSDADRQLLKLSALGREIADEHTSTDRRR